MASLCNPQYIVAEVLKQVLKLAIKATQSNIKVENMNVKYIFTC